MAFIHGKGAKLWFSSYDLSSYFSEFAVPTKVDTSETTTFGATAKTYVVALPEATASLKGLFDGAASAVDEVLSTAFGQEAAVPFTGAPQGAVVGAQASMLNVYETEYQITTPVGDVVSTSANLQSSGNADTGKLLAANTVISATPVNGTGLDNAASTANGGVAHLHVTTNTRNGAVTVKVQHSTDNSTFVDLVSFAVVGATTIGSERVVVAAGTTVNRYLRYQVTLAGSTGSATLTVAFARR